MPLSYVLQQFDAIGPMGPRSKITIDQTFTGSAALTGMFRKVLGVDSFEMDVVTGQTSRADDHLTLVGTASILGMMDATVTFHATDLESDLYVTLEIPIAPGWTFGTPFPALPEHPSQLGPEGDEWTEPNFLTQLGLGAGKLLFSSAARADQGITAGLQFSGELYLQGPLYQLGFALPEEGPLQLTGPLNEPSSDPLHFTGIRLSAPLSLRTNTFGPLTISDARILLKSGHKPLHDDLVPSTTQKNGLYLLASGVFGGRPIELVGSVDFLDGARDVSVLGRFTDFETSGFASLSQMSGVDGMESTLPEDFPAPGGISITEFGLSFDYIDFSIGSLELGIGTKVHWEVLPSVMSLKEVSVAFLVVNPFGAGRQFITTLTGQLAFKKFSLAAFAEYPTFRIGAGLSSGETLPFGDVIESLLPGASGVPDMTITRLVLNASPKDKTFLLTGSVSDVISIPVGKTAFDVAEIVFSVERNAAGATRGAFSTQMELGGALVFLAGEMGDGLVLTGNVKDFDLQGFWQLVTGESLPSEVPDIVLETMTVQYNTKSKAFSIKGNATIEWDFLSEQAPPSTSVEFSFSRSPAPAESGATSVIAASLSLQGQGPIEITPGFGIESFNLLFDYQSGKGWKLSGGLSADLFKTALSLQASYETTAAGTRMALRAVAEPPKKLIDLAGVGSYTFQQLDLAIERKPADGGKTRTGFELRVASTLSIDHVLDAGGYLSLGESAEGVKRLVFKPYPDTGTFKISFPAGQGLSLRLELFEIGFQQEADGAWAFTGSTYLGIDGCPPGMDQIFPSRMFATLTAGKAEASVTATSVTDPMPISLGSVGGSDLGALTVQVTKVGVSLKPTLGLVAEIGIGFPAELNDFLGNTTFLVYQEGNPLTMSRTQFTISSAGVTLKFVTSPFAGASTVAADGGASVEIGFGKYGAIRIKLPTFVYDGISQYFECGSGFEITKPLSLPLSPLKHYLSGAGSDDFADMFPDKVPLEKVSLVDGNGDLKTDELVAFLKKTAKVPDDVVAALKKTAKVLNRFPETFKRYLSIEIPSKLDFKLGFSPSGRIDLALLAPEEPVRFLMASPVAGVVPMPGLTGIELRKLLVGTLSAGTLFVAEVDAILDQFDLPSLAASLMLPSNPSFPLPTSDQLARHLVLQNVYCMIPVSAGLPIPIPVFYDQIGFDYLGLEGVGLGAHIAFPKPDLAGVTTFFSTLAEFASDSKTRLDPKTPPGGLDLVYSFWEEYLQAPEYLGGGSLGIRDRTIEISLWKYVATMMNFFKSFSINDFIGAIPIEYRVGSAAYKLAFMSFDADWLLTTLAEFRAGAFEKLKLTSSDRDDFLAVLPGVAASGGGSGGSGERGLVAFFRGEADFTVLRMEVALGLAASGTMGFNTGFKFDGTVATVIDMVLQGAIRVGSPGGSATSTMELTGSTALTIAGHEALGADLRMTESSFDFSGDLNLFPKSWPIKVWGKVDGSVGKGHFSFLGEVRNTLFSLTLSKSRIDVTHEHFRIAGRWLGADFTLDVTWAGSNPTLAGSFSYELSSTVELGEVKVNGVKLANSVKVQLDSDATLAISISKTALAMAVNVAFKVDGSGFSTKWRSSVAYNARADILDPLKDVILGAPLKYLAHLIGDATKWLASIDAGTIGLDKSDYAAVGAGLKTAYKASTSTCASLMKSAGYGATATGKALKEAYAQSAEAAAKLLRGAKFTSSETGAFLKSVSASLENAAKWLKSAGYGSDDTSRALKGVYKKGSKDVARALRGAGYSASQVGASLKNVFGEGSSSAGKILKDVGFSSGDIAGVLRSVYGKSAKETAKILKKELDYGKDTVKSALKSAGFSHKEIDKAIDWLKGLKFW